MHQYIAVGTERMFIEPSASTTIARLTNSPCYSNDSSYCSCYTVKYYNTIQYNTTQYNTVYNGGQKGEGGYAVSRWTLNRWVLSLFRKILSDSAVLRTAGSSFHHWGPKTEKSWDFADRPLLALSDGGTRRPAEVVERRDRAGVCGFTNAWR